MKKEIICKIFSLEGKVAIITGGAGMLGKEYTKILTAAGAAEVIWFDIKHSKPVNITDEKLVEEAVNIIMEKCGRIDILINNAGLNPPPSDTENYKPYEKFSLERWRKEIDVGLTGAMICTKAVAPIMMKQKSGVIVNIVSDLALIAPNNSIYDDGKFKSIAYCTVKGALLEFTRAWASYLAPYGVRVNALAPGGVFNNQDAKFVEKNAKLNMLGRMAGKDEYNGAILFLCSDASSYMTGSVLVIDGGRTAW